MDNSAELPEVMPPSWQGQWLGWLCLTILAGFTWWPFSYYQMVAWPGLLLWVLGWLVLGAWAVWLLRQRYCPFRSLGYGFDGLVAIAAGVLVLSSLWSAFPPLAVGNSLLALAYPLLLYVLRNWMAQGRLTPALLWRGFCLVGILAGAIGLLKLGYDGRAGSPLWNHWPLGHHNFVAGYLLLVLPPTLALALAHRDWRSRSLLGAAVGMLGVDLYFTHSRGGLLGLLAVGVGAWLVGLWWFPQRRRGGLLLGLVGLVILGGLILSNYRVQQILRVNLQERDRPVVALQIDGPAEDRLWMARTALNIIQDRPLLGVGPGNLARVYNLYRPVGVGEGASHLQQLHNTPLHLLGELGLAGLGLYGLLLFLLARLWWRLARQPLEREERLLWAGAGGGLLGYGISSLTDFQLENLPISAALACLIALLLQLGDRLCRCAERNCGGESPLALSWPVRRWFSLVLLGILGASWLVSAPVVAASALGYGAKQGLRVGNLADAYDKLTLAARLVPWDPVYPLVAGYHLLEAARLAPTAAIAKKLVQSAQENWQQAVVVAPNDAWFHHNLALLMRERDPLAAEQHLRRSLQLLPRAQGYYRYYLLGRLYLERERREAGIAALALEALITPEFLTLPLWSQPPLAGVRAEVVEQAIADLTQLQAQLPNHGQIADYLVLWRWWYNLPGDRDGELSPLVQSVLLADSSPEKALEILNSAPISPKASHLLKAWLDPQRYLQDYLAEVQGLLVPPELLAKSISQHRHLRDWLHSLQVPLVGSHRQLPVFAYRNAHIEQAAEIFLPPEIQRLFLVSQLGLFPSWPRSLPALETLIQEIAAARLNLLHPTQTDFRLAPTDLSENR